MSNATVAASPHTAHATVPPRPYQRALARLTDIVRGGGVLYATLYIARWVLVTLGRAVEICLIGIEQRRRLVEPWTISAQRFTVDQNRALWNSYDWATRGEEWTSSPEWKARVIHEFLLPHVPIDGAVLEIGPGGGRWTDVLQKRARRLVVLDVSERALELCRERFADCDNVQYLLGDGSTVLLPDSSMDAIWSYDVFVHINPSDARRYFREVSRVLKPGGKAIIHHPGKSLWGRDRPGWRSDLTDAMVTKFIGENGLHFVFRSDELVNPGDRLSVILKPAQR